MSQQQTVGQPPERRRTNQSNATFDTLRRRGTAETQALRDEHAKGPFQEHYSCYGGLSWDALRGYLLGKHPHLHSKLVARKEHDQWVFELPERLTKQDQDNIAALRDQNQAAIRRKSLTPED